MNYFTITTFKLGRACVAHLATVQPRAAVEAHQRTLPDVLYVIVEPTP